MRRKISLAVKVRWMSLPSNIEALLLGAEANACVALKRWEQARELYRRALEIAPEAIDPEQPARLAFLTEDYEALPPLIERMEEGPARLWAAVLEVARGGCPEEDSWIDDAEFHKLYIGYILNGQGRREEAEPLWLEPGQTFAKCWELRALGKWMLGGKESDCQLCQEARAKLQLEEYPVCDDCWALATNEDFTLEVMRGEHPELLERLEELTGEPIDVDPDYGRTYEPRLPGWRPPPEEPLLELTALSELLDCLDEEARRCWDLATEESGRELPTGDTLWRVLKDKLDSGEDNTLATAFQLSPPESDLIWTLNIARWDRGLWGYEESDLVSPRDLAIALVWYAESDGRSEHVARVRSRTWLNGHRLTSGQRKEFERLLSQKTDDLYLRYLLSNEAENKTQAMERMLWFLKHHPGLCHHHRLYFGGQLNGPDSQHQLICAWSEVLRERPSEPEVMKSVASFLSGSENELQLALLKRAADLNPGNPGRSWDVALHYGLSAKYDSRSGRHRFAEAARWALEAERIEVDRDMRLYYLGENALYWGVLSGEWDLLEKVAERYLKHFDEATPDPDGGAYGDYPAGMGYTGLGHVAFGRGDLKLAGEHLLRSVEDCWEYPPLGLANKLLKAGETEVLLEFLRSLTWLDCPELEEWISSLESGETDFTMTWTPDDLQDWCE